MGSGWHHGSSVPSWLLLMVGASGLAVLCQYRHSLSHKLLLWRIRRQVRRCKKKIHIVNSEETWASVLPLLLREVGNKGALGMDCEWTELGGQRQPVALLQLASHSGACVLVHLTAFTAPLPASLQSLLGDVAVVKSGVGIIQDKRFLEADYGLQVEGCVDLRHLALCCPEPGGGGKAGLAGTAGLGLAALSLSHLGHTLDKDWRVRASNWQAEHLTQRQKSYAAEDALAGMQLLTVLCAKLWTPGWRSGSWLLPFLPSPFFLRRFLADTHNICHQYLDLKFSNSSKRLLQQDNSCVNQKPVLRKISQATRAYSPRKSPLYYNCQLLAPDDSPLCTCDPKKAKWYVEKGLGVEVQHNPLVVRLNFEPAGRPRAECQDESFYVQERHNVCVVCGQEHSYIKKNVVPHEYRKYFPSILKDHQSHDIVLLCIKCHRVSNAHDTVLKDTLARECNVPLGREASQKVRVDNARKAVRNAASALLKSRSTIPEARVRELEDVVKAYFTVDSISHELLEEAANIDAREWIEDYQGHGQRVCQAYMRKGLVELQQRWRRHFIDTMQPEYLPRFWSVTHNLQKMWDVMAGLSQDHPDFGTYKLILVGIDITDSITEFTQ
ncbi:exonuclease 3'-5' domain-containing protein 2-like isoform X2 [Eriocheir sinensis]|nr:exonuclease 3'-5' domain-containing protein 2-like isoform X2 [Eriocheir sinensis]